MLQPFKQKLASMRIVLASGSPRRKEILNNVGLLFEVVPSVFEENLDKTVFKEPYEYAIATAKNKAFEVAQRLSTEKRIPDLIIGCDTVVTLDNEIFEKPRDKDHAFEILSKFSGRQHTVYTGVVFIWNISANLSLEKSSFHSFYAATQVCFAKLDPATIWAYIETGEPMDKAGGYGIQAEGGTLIEEIHGDYFNVMGFPLNKFSQHLIDVFLKAKPLL